MNKIFYSIAIAGILSISCQSNEKKAAQGAIDRYIVFVDSVNEAKFDKRKERWNFIEQEHLRKKNDAEAALNVFSDSDKVQQRKRISERDAKYKGIKASIDAE